MPALAFDTHAYVKKLRDAGVPEAQAEIQLEAIVAILEKRIATKEDLDLQKVEIQRDIKELDVKLETGLRELDVKLESQIAGVKRDIKELEMRLLIRLGALLMIGIGAVATLVKLL